jgi:hypothetical protein
MSRFRTMNKKVIELFDEKTGSVVRSICFRSPKEFDEFVNGCQNACPHHQSNRLVACSANFVSLGGHALGC